MTDEFTLTINYKGEDLHFQAKLILQGYSHKFQIMVDEKEIYFEPDEEGHYRAVKMPWQEDKALAKIDRELLSGIQQEIEIILA